MDKGFFHKEIKDFKKNGLDSNFKDIECSKKKVREKGYGRIEKREYFQTSYIYWFTEKNKWKGLTSVG